MRQVEITRGLGMHKSTICREVKRNTALRGYRPKQAHRFAIERRMEKAKPRISYAEWRRIEALLRQSWSPEQVGGRLELEGWRKVSHKRIYQHIYADKQAGGDLHTHLRCQKQRKKRYGANDRRGKIPGRTGIEMRPAVVDAKSRIGDWEADTIIGKSHKGAVVSLVERKTAKLVADAEITVLKPIRDKVHTITKDNGLEFRDHARVAKAIKTDIYFARPYASNQRGLNENVNGLVRQYLPKSRRLDTISDEELDRIMHRLNHRPRKTLGFRTPYEVFFNSQTQLTRVALAS